MSKVWERKKIIAVLIDDLAQYLPDSDKNGQREKKDFEMIMRERERVRQSYTTNMDRNWEFGILRLEFR